MSYQSWLETPGVFRCVLVELDYIESGTVKTAFFSNAAFVSRGTDTPAHQAYDPFVLGGLDFDRNLSEIFTGYSRSRNADIELVKLPVTQWLAGANVAGQQIRIYLGDKSWPKAQFQQVIAGVCDVVWPEQNKLRIKFADRAKLLQQPVLTERYTSGTAEGALKPLCLGRCYNIRPVLIDAANHIYQFNSVPSEALTAVRFNGAVIDQADYSVDLTASTLTLLVQPIGDVTCDVDGVKISGTWLQDANQLINYLLSRMDITANVSTLPGYLLGLYLSADTRLNQVLDNICNSVSSYWFFDRLGQFQARQFNGVPATLTASITDDQNLYGTRSPRRRITPLHTVTLGYSRNWTPLSTIAADLHENHPATAKRLASEELQVSATDAAILDGHADADTSQLSTLLVNKSDAETELAARLALAAVPRYVYETQQLATPFQWLLGDGVQLQSPGVNGTEAVITRLSENPLTGVVRVEFWQ